MNIDWTGKRYHSISRHFIEDRLLKRKLSLIDDELSKRVVAILAEKWRIKDEMVETKVTEKSRKNAWEKRLLFRRNALSHLRKTNETKSLPSSTSTAATVAVPVLRFSHGNPVLPALVAGNTLTCNHPTHHKCATAISQDGPCKHFKVVVTKHACLADARHLRHLPCRGYPEEPPSSMDGQIYIHHFKDKKI